MEPAAVTDLTVGSRVEGRPRSDGKWAAGVVQAIHDESTVGVTYFGAPGSVVQDIATLRRLEAPDASLAISFAALEPQMAVSARYSDARWYPAIIVKVVSPDDVHVRFDGYDSISSVPVEWVQRSIGANQPFGSSATSFASDGAAAVDGAQAVHGTYADLVIPLSLRPREGDTAEIRERKKKRIASLKRDFRREAEEKAAAARAQSWQEFAAAAVKRKAPGALPTAGATAATAPATSSGVTGGSVGGSAWAKAFKKPRT